MEVNNQRILLQPVVGVGAEGSIYHSNLVKFKFTAELGLDWQNKTQDPGSETTSTHLLQRYHALIEFRRTKPYATAVFADKDLTYRDYDFFTRTRVDDQRYGLRTGYSLGPFPFSITAMHHEENETELSRPTRSSEDTINFNTHNTRRAGAGSTDLNYSCNSFMRQDDGFSTQHGFQQNLSVFNAERLGLKDWIRLHSMLNYNSLENTAQPNENILLQQNLNLKHTPRFSTSYDYSFSSTTAGDSDSDNHQARVGLAHQLYDNFTSSLDLHGNQATSHSPGSSQDTLRYGVSIGEQYYRHLGTWGRLTLGYNGTVDHEDREASGAIFHITNESHTLTDSIITYLNQPLVDSSTVVVTDPTQTIIYVLGFDYDLLPHGALLEIRRRIGGTIPNGGAVLVSYDVNNQPSAHFLAIANGANVRLDLWNNLLGIYARWNTLQYSGADQLVLHNIDDKVFGLDTTWRWLRAGAEYEISDSNLSPMNRARLYQSAQFTTADGTTLGLDFEQAWTEFRDSHINQTTYSMIGRFQQRITRNLSWYADAGLRLENGATFEREAATARTGLNWKVGKLSVKLDYDYNRETHLGDLRQRHYLFLRVRRNF